MDGNSGQQRQQARHEFNPNAASFNPGAAQFQSPTVEDVEAERSTNSPTPTTGQIDEMEYPTIREGMLRLDLHNTHGIRRGPSSTKSSSSAVTVLGPEAQIEWRKANMPDTQPNQPEHQPRHQSRHQPGPVRPELYSMLPSSIAPAPFDQQLPSAHASQPSQRSLAALNELRAQVQALTPSTGYDLGRSQARLQAPTQTQATFTQDWAPRVQPRHRRRLDQGPEPSAADIYPEDFEGYESNSSFESPSIYLPLGAPASQYQQAHATQTQIQHGRAQSFMPQFQVPPPVQQPGLSQRQGPVQGRGVQPAQARIHQGGSRSSYVPPPGDLRALYGSLPLPLPPTAGPPQARIPRAGSQPSYAPTPGDLRSLHDTLPLPTIGGPPNTSTQIPLNSSQEDKKYGFVVNGIGHGRDWNPPYEEPTPQFRTRPGEGSLKSIWDKPEGKVSSTPGTALLRHDNFWDGHERGGPAIKELWEKPFPPVMPTQSFDPLNPTSPARNVLLQDPNFLREEMDRLKSSMPPLLPDRRIWGEPSAPTQTSSSQETGPQQRGSWSRLDLWGPRPVGSGTRSPSSTSSTSTARPPRAAGTADTAGGASPTPSAGGRGAADPAGVTRSQGPQVRTSAYTPQEMSVINARLREMLEEK